MTSNESNADSEDSAFHDDTDSEEEGFLDADDIVDLPHEQYTLDE